MRRGVECRAGGTGAESGGSHQSIRSVFTGDFGKPVSHLPRKLHAYTEPCADTAMRPYAELSNARSNKSIKTPSTHKYP